MSGPGQAKEVGVAATRVQDSSLSDCRYCLSLESSLRRLFNMHNAMLDDMIDMMPASTFPELIGTRPSSSKINDAVAPDAKQCRQRSCESRCRAHLSAPSGIPMKLGSFRRVHVFVSKHGSLGRSACRLCAHDFRRDWAQS